MERSSPHYHNKSLKLTFQSSSAHFVEYSLGVHHILSVVHLSRCFSMSSCLLYYCRNPVQVFSLHWQRGVKISQNLGESAINSLLHKALLDSTNVRGRTAGMLLTSPFLASSCSSYNLSVVPAGCTLRPHYVLAFERAISL